MDVERSEAALVWYCNNENLDTDECDITDLQTEYENYEQNGENCDAADRKPDKWDFIGWLELSGIIGWDGEKYIDVDENNINELSNENIFIIRVGF